MKPRQLELPVTAAQRQPVAPRESAAVHGAVLALRRRGHRVYRAGRYALVDGEYLDPNRLAGLVRTGGLGR